MINHELVKDIHLQSLTKRLLGTAFPLEPQTGKTSIDLWRGLAARPYKFLSFLWQ